jgi:hypothetical protein
MQYSTSGEDNSSSGPGFSDYMEPECSLQYSLYYVTCSHPEPDSSSLIPIYKIYVRYVLISSSNIVLDLLSGLFPSGFSQILHALLFTLYWPNVKSLSSAFIG